MNKIIKKNLMSLVVLVFLCVGFVVAGNVYVSDGDLDVDSDFSVDTSTLFVDSDNNRVGIGNTVPNRILSVRDTAVQVSFRSDDGESTIINMGDASDENIGRIEYDNGDNSMYFKTNTTDNLVIRSNGDVDIVGNVDADSYTEHSVALDLSNSEKSALDYFTTTWEDRTYLNDGKRVYNHTNDDDIDLLYSVRDVINCEQVEVFNKELNETEIVDENCVVSQVETKSLSVLVELQRDAIKELVDEVDVLKLELVLLTRNIVGVDFYLH